MTRFDLWIGNLTEAGGLIAGVYFVYLAIAFENILVELLLGLLGIGFVLFFSHCLTHYLVGSLLGIRFRYYLVTRTALKKLDLPLVDPIVRRIPLLAIKTESTSMREASSTRRAVMFASGTVSSISLPLVLVGFSYGGVDGLVWLLLAAIGVGNLLFTLYFSPKVGDLSRAREALSSDSRN